MATSVRRPKVLLRYGRQNQPLRISNADLIVDSVAQTFLTADISSGSSTLTVQRIDGFAVNQVLLIGEFGNQASEIVKTHASSAPSGTTITLAANTIYSHSSGTPVRFIGFDKVEISWAATVSGSKTTLATNALTPELDWTEYDDSAASGAYYFARWNNSIGSSFSAYSDPAPAQGYSLNTARYIIDSAMKGINKKQSDIITDDYCFMELNNFQTEVLKEQKRWAFLQKFNTIIGQAVTGTWSVPVPTDLDDQYTDKSTWHLRIGGNSNMTFVDKEKWDEMTAQVVTTTLASILNVGDATMTLTSSADFGASGSVLIGAYTYSYTANNTATGVLTLSVVVPSGENQASGAAVFQNAATGEPSWFTIFGGKYYHYPLVSSTYSGRNYYADYYQAQTVINLDTDAIVVPDQTAAIYFLQWKMLVRLNNGDESNASASKKALYEARKVNVKAKDSMGRTFRLKPLRNDLKESNVYGNDPKWQRDAGWINW